ncbi:alpha/beta fold hydrolase, partial [Actinomadura adrarensis]
MAWKPSSPDWTSLKRALALLGEGLRETALREHLSKTAGLVAVHGLCMSRNFVEHSQRMHVVRDGAAEASPLLLVHGSGASGGSRGPLAPALAARHHVVRVDLPGCGQSLAAPTFHVPDQAGRVAAMLDELGLGAVTVVAHSSGGYVATSLVEQRPDLVRSLALISTGPSMDALLPQPLILRVLL